MRFSVAARLMLSLCSVFLLVPTTCLGQWSVGFEVNDWEGDHVSGTGIDYCDCKVKYEWKKPGLNGGQFVGDYSAYNMMIYVVGTWTSDGEGGYIPGGWKQLPTIIMNEPDNGGTDLPFLEKDFAIEEVECDAAHGYGLWQVDAPNSVHQSNYWFKIRYGRKNRATGEWTYSDDMPAYMFPDLVVSH